MNTLPAAPGDILAVWTGNGPEQNVIRVAEALVGKPAFVPRPDYAAVAAALGMPLGSVSPTAAGPLDDADLGILDGVREMFEAADATPAGLPGRIRFSLALRDLDVEMARLAAEEDSPVLAVRGVEQSRLITFDSDSLTIMIRIDANADGTARVDGWLAPPQHREIEMKTSAESLHVASDEQGRFAFAAVPREARRRGLLEGNAGRPAVGSRYARAGLRQLGWTEEAPLPDRRQVHEAHHALAARLLGILAEWESMQGRTEYGLRLLDRAEGLVAPDDRGILLVQRGLLYMRTWRGPEALSLFDDAIVQLAGNPAETANLATALLNRSFAHLNAGDVRRARADLSWCRRIAAEEGHELIGAKALHNLGYCDLLAGDIPTALQLFTEAAKKYQLIAPGYLPVLAMDKARALLAAGLADDAAHELDEAMAAFRRLRMDYDLAEAELARSEAALATGDLAAARHWAGAARRRFLRQSNQACACLAELTRLRARSLAPSRQPGIAADAVALAGRLRGCGLPSDADMAELIAARTLLGAGHPDEARRRIGGVRSHGPVVPLAVSLLRRLATAELAELEGQSGKALAELRAGLATVQARRGRLGSIDLQTGTAALGADLAAAGLRLALQRRSAPLVFAWLERSRAQAFRIRPVLPPADPGAASALAELRQLGQLIRTAELTGNHDQAAIAKHAELRREIREHGWQASNRDAASAQASLGEVSAALEQNGQSLVSILARQGRTLAVVVRRRSVRIIELGDFAVATEAARRLNADLDTLAGRQLPNRLEAVVRESIRHQADVLTTELIAPLRSAIGDDGIVFVPAGPLASIPWSVLPDLRGRPVTVCPSASSWLAAWRRGLAATGPAAAPPLLVAGPDLEHAAAEVAEIATIYAGCRVLLPEEATVSATLRALDGVPLAHLAAHGHHDGENVLFSRLDLADGPLMAYDIQQLTAAPRHVILSSCDVGRTVVRPGEEVLGFTAALLYIGTATVISSVARVADAAAAGMMTGYHRLLAAGANPAEALAEAALGEPFSPFVCFGGGSPLR
jgi:CHAT domain-containing protein